MTIHQIQICLGTAAVLTFAYLIHLYRQWSQEERNQLIRQKWRILLKADPERPCSIKLN